MLNLKQLSKIHARVFRGPVNSVKLLSFSLHFMFHSQVSQIDSAAKILLVFLVFLDCLVLLVFLDCLVLVVFLDCLVLVVFLVLSWNILFLEGFGDYICTLNFIRRLTDIVLSTYRGWPADWPIHLGWLEDLLLFLFVSFIDPFLFL